MLIGRNTLMISLPLTQIIFLALCQAALGPGTFCINLVHINKQTGIQESQLLIITVKLLPGA